MLPRLASKLLGSSNSSASASREAGAQVPASAWLNPEASEAEKDKN